VQTTYCIAESARFPGDSLDTRNFFVSETEPLRQNQFGATAGGPIRRNRLLYFGYYKGRLRPASQRSGLA
jgi:hypothetical protein